MSHQADRFPQGPSFPSRRIADFLAAHLSPDFPESHPEIPDPRDPETGDPLLDRMRQGMADASAEIARIEAAERRRPARKHEALVLLMLAALAQALPAGRDAARLFDPGVITPVRPPAPGFEEAVGKALSGRVIRHLRNWAEVDEEAAADPRIRIFAARPDLSGRDRSGEVRLQREKIREEVCTGRAILLVTAERELLRGDLAALAGPDLRLPRVSADLLLEVLVRTHSDGLDPDALRPLLPAPEALARLSAIALQAAFMAPTAEAVAVRLARMAGPANTPTLTLSDVRGQPDTVRVLGRMVDDLGRWRRGGLAWSQVTASAILIGPPGTGKTMAAEATAGSAGVPFIATSYSHCQKAGHQGDMLAALNAGVEEAIARAPSVFFIDELDSFMARRGDGNSEKYQRGVVNGLLEQLTRLARSEGVFVLGATNHVHDIDPAVVRSGRFDLKVAMMLSDAAGLEDLLMTGLARLDPAPNLDDRLVAALARRLLGCSGADVAALLRDAAGQARAADRPVSATDLTAAAARLAPPLDPDLERRVAIHEVGHLLVGHIMGRPAPRRVRLTAQGGFVAGVATAIHTLDSAEAELAALMGGRSAEVLVFGAPSSGSGTGSDSDLARATRIAMQIEVQWRLSDGDGGLSWANADRDDLLYLDPMLRARIDARLKAAEATALNLLDHRMTDLHHIARTLLREREFDTARIATLLADVRPTKPDPDDAPRVIPFPLIAKDTTPDASG